MLLYEKNNHIGVLTIDRPEALNAINSELLRRLHDIAKELAADTSLRCLILTGAGKAFVAGADIAEMRNLSKTEAVEFAQLGHGAFEALESLPFPVIAAVNGYALGGGCELSLCADIRIASERARFGQPEVGLGITPGFGGNPRLIRTLNRADAMELVFTGRVINAEEALRMGLVSRVVPAERLMDEAMALAEAIAENAPIAVRAAKAALHSRYTRFLRDDLDRESELFGSCFETADQRMAMTAFVEKQPKSEFIGE